MIAFTLPHKLYADQITTQIATVEPSELLQYPDTRILAVQSYLDSHACGTEIQDFDTATEFVDDADTNKIDWRILPIVWIKESQCGKHQLNGDGFGWMSGEGLYPFTSLDSAISYISAHLALHPYAGKPLAALVGTYNNSPEYLTSFMGYYGQITTSYNAYNQLMPMLVDNQLNQS